MSHPHATVACLENFISPHIATEKTPSSWGCCAMSAESASSPERISAFPCSLVRDSPRVMMLDNLPGYTNQWVASFVLDRRQ